MSNTTISPNMSLVVPSVGVDPFPDWANNINADLSILDGHNHSPGFGVAINPTGIVINADLPFNSNNATLLRSARFAPQISPIPNSGLDVGCLYVSGNEVYYNDVSGGNQVQITNNGSVNAGAGSITGLPSGTASASFSAGTFVWQSATATAANMDFGSAILRNSTASSKGLTLQPPAAMAADITETLPAIPAVTSFMQMDNSGNMSASIPIASGITGSNIAANTITETNMAPLSIGTPELIDGSVTQPKRAALGLAVGAGVSGTFTLSNGAQADITGLSATLTTTGRPVQINLQPFAGSAGDIGVASGTAFFYLFRDATQIAVFRISSGAGVGINIPPGAIFYTDTGASAASHTYKFQGNYAGSSAVIENSNILVYEL